MNLKKLDSRISFLPRAAKKKLLAKFLVLTNDSFIWLEATQKERSNFVQIPEVSQQEGELFRAFLRITARSSRI
jgi:hypothetical protein